MSEIRPAQEAALRAFREHFLNRTDLVAILAPWGKPCPIDANGSLDALLLGHLLGNEAPETTVRYTHRRGAGAMKGRFRIGSYCPGPDDSTRWLCIDFDGAGHADALADPKAAALAAHDAFTAARLPAYLEQSGGGNGWHLWCFFDPPIPAAKAQRLGRALAPRNAPLAGGSGEVADPATNRGIEIFPKQTRHRRGGGYGNLVWLPWWHNAPQGGNVFFRYADGALESYAPTEFATASPEIVDRLLAAHAPAPRQGERAEHTPNNAVGAARSAPSSGVSDPAWAAWRRRALSALPLEAVYGSWLTGQSAGPGWLECRDPSSATGDQHPSASVADGSGDAERAAFHSFISGRTLSVFDFLVEHGGVADFRAARERIAELTGVPEPTPTQAGNTSSSGPPTRKPKIVIRTAEHEVVDDAIAALSRVDGVYCRGQLLVHVVEDASLLAGVIHASGSLRIAALGIAGIRDRLTAAADWVALKERQGEVEEVPAHPPAWAAPAVESRKSWPKVRYLEAVVESPVLRPDGTVLDRRGYDDATGLLYAPNSRYPVVPTAPTREDAQRAIAELLEVVVDFPFKTDSHRAAWLAGVLTPLARYAFRGPSPLFLMDANVRGAGKSLLADVTGEIIGGRAMPRMPQALNETEEAKRITSIVLEGDRVVLIDNINRPLGSGALDAALTGTVWSDRILGKSEQISLPLITVWYGTGNNVTFRGDTARRCLHIRLDSNLENPETRGEFAHPDLLGWVRANRPRLVTSALAVLRGYFVAGRPSMGLKSWGSFEGWSELVRNTILWAGLPDPGETRAELAEVDNDSTVLADLIAGWEELPGGMGVLGCTIAQALDVLRDDASGSRYGRLRGALGELCAHAPNQLPATRRVGNALRRFRGRVVGGRKIQTRVSAGNNLWFVQRVDGDTSTAPVRSSGNGGRGGG